MSSQDTIVVTGGTGRCGGALLERLIRARCRVRTLTRQDSGSAAAKRLRSLGVEVLHGNLMDPRSSDRLLRGADRAYLITSSLDGFEDEVRCGINLVEAAKRCGLRHLVFQSTTYAGTVLPHCATKGEIEKRLAASGVPFTILRPGVFYETTLLVTWRLALDAGRRVVTLPVRPELARYWVQVPDVAEAGTRVLGSRPAGRVYDVVSPEACSYYETLPFFQESAGITLKFTFQPTGLKKWFPRTPRRFLRRLTYAYERDYYAPINSRTIPCNPTPLRRDYGIRCIGPRRYVRSLAEQTFGGPCAVAAHQSYRGISKGMAAHILRMAPGPDSRLLQQMAVVVFLQEGLGARRYRATALRAWLDVLLGEPHMPLPPEFRRNPSLFRVSHQLASGSWRAYAGSWRGIFDRYQRPVRAVGKDVARGSILAERDRSVILHRHFIAQTLALLGTSPQEQALICACLLAGLPR